MHLCLIFLVASVASALLITIDNVNMVCACVYLLSLALIQQWPTRDIGQYKDSSHGKQHSEAASKIA